MRLLRRFLLPALVLLVLSPALVQANHTGVKDTDPDPDAPAGAPLSWLPDEDWVLEHWLPYDFRRLQKAMGGMEFVEIQTYVHDNVHTLSDLAREKGKRPKAVMRYLVKPWKGKVSKARLRTLRSRTKRTFTQAHLFQHMIGHPFHTRSLQRRTEEIFGVTPPELAPLRRQGMSFAEVAEREAGRSFDDLVDVVMGQLRATMRKAVRTKQSPRSWQRFYNQLQEQRLPSYLRFQPPPGQGGGAQNPGTAPAPHAGHDGTRDAEPVPEGLEGFGEQPGVLGVARAVGRGVLALLRGAVAGMA